jgi:hypothetical protein
MSEQVKVGSERSGEGGLGSEKGGDREEGGRGCKRSSKRSEEKGSVGRGSTFLLDFLGLLVLPVLLLLLLKHLRLLEKELKTKVVLDRRRLCCLNRSGGRRIENGRSRRGRLRGRAGGAEKGGGGDGGSRRNRDERRSDGIEVGFSGGGDIVRIGAANPEGPGEEVAEGGFTFRDLSDLSNTTTLDVSIVRVKNEGTEWIGKETDSEAGYASPSSVRVDSIVHELVGEDEGREERSSGASEG